MVEVSATAGNSARNGGGALCSDAAASVRLTAALSEKAIKVFTKPYRALVDVLHVSERDAHYRLSSSRKYSALDVSKLLQSEEGIHFLVALMDQARPRWWRAVLKMGVLGSIEQRRQNELKLMQKVFNADTDAKAMFSDSFRSQDPDFFGAVLSGFDEMSALGGADRSVVPKARK